MFKLKMIKKPILFKLKCDFTFPPIVLANMQEKEAIPTKEQQEIVPDKNYDGLSKVTVNPIPDEYIIPDGNLEINQNGTYDVNNYSSAEVNVPEKVLGTKTITTNGTYNATDDNLDGYSQVEVATSGVDINEYFETECSTNSTNRWLKNNFIKKVPSIVIADNVTSLLYFAGEISFAPKIICNSNVTNMSYLYSNNTSKSIDVSGLVTSRATDMKNMFYNCSSLTSLDLSNFDTSKVTGTGMGSMFENCNALSSLNLSGWDTSKISNFDRTFINCKKLTSLDLSSFITNKVISTGRMFQNCSSLMNLDIRNFDFTNVTSYSNMFTGVPDDCLIIVKDDTAKEWITSKFTTLTNVKTVAELEQ